MARYKKGIQGPFSGKIGSVVGSSWRGVEYMRSHGKPNSQPATEKQLHQRYVFAMVTGWLRPLRELIWIGFQVFKGTKTPMNGLVSFILKEAVTGFGKDSRIVFSKVVFSRGELFISLFKEVLWLSGCILNIKWENGPDSAFNKDNDKATFIVYNPVKGAFVTFKNITARSANEVSLKLPKHFKNHTIHCWMHYVSAEGDAVSTGVYVGEISVLN